MSGGNKDAEITVGADASAVERATAVMKAGFVNAASAIKSSIGEAARSVVTSLGEVALAQGRVNFSAQHQQVRDFEASSARLAVSMGRDLESVRRDIETTGQAINKRPQEVARWAAEVGRLTYNYEGATEGARGLAGLAAETGRSLEDYRGLAVELENVGHVGGDTTHVIGSLATQAKALGTVGGVAAFTDQIEGLGDVISHFSVKSEQDFLKVTAAAGALTKGFSPQAAQRVQQGAFGAISGNVMGWERFLGRNITDDFGQVKDPTGVLKEVVEKIRKRHSGGDAEFRRALQWNFGAETGAALYRANKTGAFEEAARAAGLAPSTAPQHALDAFKATDAGKREAAQVNLDVASRDLMGSATLLGHAADALQQFASKNPITSTLVATALGAGASSFMSGFGKTLSTIMGGKGEGGAVGGLVDLATKGTGAGKLGGVVKGLGAAGFAAASLGYAYSEISGTADEIYGSRGGFSSAWDDLKFKAAGKSAVAGGNRGFAAQQAQNERNLAVAHARQGIEASIGIASAIGIDVSGARERGHEPLDAKILAAAFAQAIGDKLTVEVSNTSDTPITAATKSGRTSSAGNQGQA